MIGLLAWNEMNVMIWGLDSMFSEVIYNDDGNTNPNESEAIG